MGNQLFLEEFLVSGTIDLVWNGELRVGKERLGGINALRLDKLVVLGRSFS